jgi:hypothetical protein
MANMGTVSVSYQQFRITRNLQETKSQHTLAINRPSGWLSLSFSFPPSEERLAFLRFSLTSRWKPCSMMGEAHERTNITRRKAVKKLYFASGFN